MYKAEMGAIFALLTVLFCAGCGPKEVTTVQTSNQSLPQTSINSRPVLASPEAGEILDKAGKNLDKAKTDDEARTIGEALSALGLAMQADPAEYKGKASARLVSKDTDSKRGGFIAVIAITNTTFGLDNPRNHTLHVKASRASRFFGSAKPGDSVSLKIDKGEEKANEASDYIRLEPLSK